MAFPYPELWEALKRTGMQERVCANCGNAWLTRTVESLCPPCAPDATERGDVVVIEPPTTTTRASFKLALRRAASRE
jgi:RNA polymerase subunit RPABC4/transcription elongation factor Spt4